MLQQQKVSRTPSTRQQLNQLPVPFGCKLRDEWLVSKVESEKHQSQESELPSNSKAVANSWIAMNLMAPLCQELMQQQQPRHSLVRAKRESASYSPILTDMHSKIPLGYVGYVEYTLKWQWVKTINPPFGLMPGTCQSASPTTSSSGHSCRCISIIQEASSNRLRRTFAADASSSLLLAVYMYM